MTTIGTIDLIAKIDTSQYRKGAIEIDKANKGMEDSADKTSSSWKRQGAIIGAVAGAMQAVVTRAFDLIGNSVGDAVERVDTLRTFPKVLEAMGVSADKANSATKNIAKSLEGLPTSLSEGTKSVQKFVASGLDVDKATKAFLGINNALLATGADAQDTQVVMDGLGRVISAGGGDASTMQAILSRMPTVLSALSKESGKSQGELYKLFSQDPQSLLDNIIRLNEQGGAGMASLDKQAREATDGIRTGWQNMQTAITRGIAKVIEAIGSENISTFITNIGKAFETGAKFAVVGIEKIQQFFGFIRDNQETIKQLITTITILLTPAIIVFGVQSAIAFGKFITGVIMAGTQSLIAGARMAAAWLLALGPIGLIVAAVAAAAFLIISNWETIKNVAASVWQSITNAVASAFNWVKQNWPLLLGIITGPIGIAASTIIRNFDRIKSAVGNIWDWIKGVFGTIGSVAATIIKAPVNAIIGFAQNTINGFINAINNAIGAINNIPGVNIGWVSTIDIPKLAKGGIITAPTLAMVGEGNESEAVIPLSKLDQMISGDSGSDKMVVNIDMSGVMARSRADLRDIGEDIIEAVDEARIAKGMKSIGGAA